MRDAEDAVYVHVISGFLIEALICIWETEDAVSIFELTYTRA